MLSNACARIWLTLYFVYAIGVPRFKPKLLNVTFITSELRNVTVRVSCQYYMQYSQRSARQEVEDSLVACKLVRS
jgi:hypothetical protein